MARPRTFNPDDLPIPEDVRPDKTWSPIMMEMAAHVGSFATLRIVDAFAGQDVYIPVDPARSPFFDILGADKAATFAHVFGRERLAIPTGRSPLIRARRAGIITLIRQGKMTVVEGAAILRTARRYLSQLVNDPNEAIDAMPATLPRLAHDPRQLDMFGEPEQDIVSAD